MMLEHDAFKPAPARTGAASMRKHHALARDRRGVTSIEFAVAIGAVLIVVLAILDLGRLFAAQHTLNYGVEKALRYAVVNSSTATATSVADKFRTAVTPGLGAAGAASCAVTVSYPQGNAPTLPVTIAVTYRWAPASSLDSLPGFTLSSGQTLVVQH